MEHMLNRQGVVQSAYKERVVLPGLYFKTNEISHGDEVGLTALYIMVTKMTTNAQTLDAEIQLKLH